MQKVKAGSRWENQYAKTTLVRVSSDTHTRIKNLIRPGESIQDVISRAISLLETGNTLLPDTDVCVNGAINVDVNDIVNTVIERVNADINNKLTRINERLDNLIPGIEHQRDETGHTLEMVFSIQKRLEALEALPVTIPAHTPDDKPEENTRGDDNDQGQEQDEVSEERKKIIDRIKYLNKECKISYAKIAIGIGLKDTDKGRISEAINPKIRCPLTKEQIEKLFLIENSSPEGT